MKRASGPFENILSESLAKVLIGAMRPGRLFCAFRDLWTWGMILAGVIGLLFLCPIFCNRLFILLCGDPQNAAQRGDDILFRNEMIAAGTDAEFRTPGGVDDHMIACLQLQVCRGEKVDLLTGTELYVYHLNGGQLCGLFFHV